MGYMSQLDAAIQDLIEVVREELADGPEDIIEVRGNIHTRLREQGWIDPIRAQRMVIIGAEVRASD